MIFFEIILVIPFLKIIISGLYSTATIFFKVLINYLELLQQILQTPPIFIRFGWGKRKDQDF